jgi:galactonate dehydratase
MRITQVEVASTAESQQTRHLILRGDSGLSGVSELAGFDGLDGEGSIASRLRDLLLDREPFEVEAVWAARGDGSSDLGLPIISAATSAMLDLAAKELQAPTYQLLGGAVHDAVRACAVGWAGGATSEADVVAAASRTAASGYTMLRIEPVSPSGSDGSRAVADAVALVQAIREAVPDHVDLVIAADEVSSAHAAEFIHAIAATEPLWVELQAAKAAAAPLDEPAVFARAMGRGADPESLRQLVIDNVADHLVLEVDRIGGMLEARKIAALAEVYYTGVITACSDGALPLRDALCLAASLPNLSVAEVRPGLAPVENGMLSLDRFPGAPLTSSGSDGPGN